MPQTMLTVRGNLGANPDYLPEKTMEDGAILPSKLQAVVYENRRVRTADGGWTDDPRGPVKTTVQLFGNAADTVRRIDMRQGDPVIAGGSIAEPAAYASSKDGQPDAQRHQRAMARLRLHPLPAPQGTRRRSGATGRILPVRDPARDRGGASMMKFLDDEGRAGTGVGRKAVLRAHAPRPAMSGAECSCGERFATWEEYGRHVDGLVSTPPETREEAIENALADHLGDPYGRGDWDDRLEPSVGDHGLFHCGCGWKSSVPDIGEWRRHMADAILAELAEVRKRG